MYKAQIWEGKMDFIAVECDQVVKYIEALKNQIKELSHPDSEFASVNAADLIAPEKVLYKNGGKKLYLKLRDIRTEIFGTDASVKAEFERTLSLVVPDYNNDDSITNWVNTYFKNYPVMAAIIVLTRFQSDTKSSEDIVIAYLNRKVSLKQYYIRMIFRF